MMTTRSSQGAPRKRSLLLSIAAAAVATAGAAAHAQEEPQPDTRPADVPQLKERDHEDLGKLIEKYFEARKEGEGFYEAIEDLEKKMEAIGKRAKVDNMLALTSDWEAALRESKDYPGAPRGKGKAIEVDGISGVYGDEIVYWVHGPKSYRNSDAYPLVLIVPDKDQKLDEIMRLDWVEKATGIEDEMILVVTSMPKNTEDWTIIGSQGRPGGVDRILQVLKHVTNDWNVDSERIFLCGQEQGVAAAMRVAALVPDRFAGVIGRSGDPQPEPLGNFGALPVLLVAGADNATAMGHAAEERGWKHIETRASAETADIKEWIQAHSRTGHPSDVYYRPLDLRMHDAYWVRVEGFEPDAEKKPWIHAVADRETNTVTIEGEGVTRVLVSFNDRLLDLDRSVKVVVGGVVHNQMVDRDLLFMLDRARKSGDVGRVYMTMKPFDFPVDTGSSAPSGSGEGGSSGEK
ncbi:MAG: hypothetical protein R3F34_17585 [Planctomycetota bacterium]